MGTFVTLMYHNLADVANSTYTVTFESFNNQISWLKSEDFVIEGFDGLERRLITNQWPSRYVVMTFDDGHSSNLRAAEVLRKVGGQATFFLTKHFCQTRRDYLSKHDICELADLCHVGSHSVTHPFMAKMSTEHICYELSNSKVWLEQLVGKAVTTFSAPNGSMNVTVRNLAINLGYTLLGNSLEWWNDPSRIARIRTVNRIAIRRSFSLETFAGILRQEGWFFMKRRIRYHALAIVKGLLTPEQIRYVRGSNK